MSQLDASTTELGYEAQNLGHRPTFMAYVYGFVLSLYLTVTAYILVVDHVFSMWPLVFVAAGLALMQFLVQLVFFLHIGKDASSRGRALVLLLMAIIVIIVVGGSLWIMSNLNYHMTTGQINKYLQGQDGL